MHLTSLKMISHSGWMSKRKIITTMTHMAYGMMLIMMMMSQ